MALLGSPLRAWCMMALLTGLLASSACVTVPPWRRETLARRDMEVGRHSVLRSGEEHAQAYREGSSGGGQVRSGGCGCN